jgi:hypothetical protein
MKINEAAVINLSHEVTKSDGTNDGIWYFGERLQIENELIIGFSPTNYHCFVICGEQEFHPRFSINPCKLQPSRKNNVRAALFIRIKNIQREEIVAFQKYLIAMKDKRTPTCHQGLLQVLERGIGIKIPRHSIFKTTPQSFLKGILQKGLVDKNNQPLEIEFYKTRSKSLADMYFDISIVRWRYGWIFSLFNLHYRFLKIFKPQITVR